MSSLISVLNTKLRKSQVEHYRKLGLRERGVGKMPAPTGDFDIHGMSREPQPKDSEH